MLVADSNGNDIFNFVVACSVMLWRQKKNICTKMNFIFPFPHLQLNSERGVMNPQTVSEGKRIIAIVDDLCSDLSILALLPPYLSAMPTEDTQHITNTFDRGHEVQSQLTDHFDIERKLESAAGDPAPSDVTDHHLSTRALVDTLRQAGYGSAYHAKYPPNDTIINFQHIINILRDLLKDRFATTVEDDVVKFAILNDTVNREKTASADVQALNREYQNEKESRRVEVEKRDAMIKKLRDEIEQLRESSELERQTFERVSAEHRVADQEKYEQEITQMQTKLAELEHDLEQVEAKCGKSEHELRQVRNKKETMLQQIIEHYDTEMSTSRQTMVGLQKEIDQDGEQLKQVEAQLSVYNAEADEYEIENRIEEQRKMHRTLISQEMEHFAQVIQACYRSYAVRLHQSQKGKKQKKKK